MLVIVTTLSPNDFYILFMYITYFYAYKHLDKYFQKKKKMLKFNQFIPLFDHSRFYKVLRFFL